MCWSVSLELGRIGRGGALAVAGRRDAGCSLEQSGGAYQVRGFAFDDELLLLQVLQGRRKCQ